LGKGKSKVNSTLRLTVVLVGAGGAAALAAWAGSRLRRRRKKDPQELERLRRLELNRRGRITIGTIVDRIEQAQGGRASRLVVYKYEVAGVTYEAAQDFSWLEGAGSLFRCQAGQTASVKYEPRRPTNSIIACEEWSGLPDSEAGGKLKAPPMGTPDGALRKP
jgi:hypothetical protein